MSASTTDTMRLGEVAYRQRLAGRPWRGIADDLDLTNGSADPASRVTKLAHRHALRNDLRWPLSDDTVAAERPSAAGALCDRACGRRLELAGTRWETTCWRCRLVDHACDYPLPLDEQHLARVGITATELEAARALRPPRPPVTEFDMPRPPHKDGPRAARLVLNEGLSLEAAAKECSITTGTVRSAIWRYYDEHPDRREVMDAAEFRTAVRLIGADDGVTVEQLASNGDAGVILVTYKSGRQDRYASLAHYAASHGALKAGRASGTVTLAANGAARRGENSDAVSSGSDASDSGEPEPESDASAAPAAATPPAAGGNPAGEGGVPSPAPEPTEEANHNDITDEAPHAPAAADADPPAAATTPKPLEYLSQRTVDEIADLRARARAAEAGHDAAMDEIARISELLANTQGSLAHAIADQALEHPRNGDGILLGALDAIVTVCAHPGLRLEAGDLAVRIAKTAIARAGHEPTP